MITRACKVYGRNCIEASMTIEQYRFCVTEAAACGNLDAYASDLALSEIWRDAADAEIPTERIAALEQIWRAAHRSVKDIAAAAGLSQRKLAERFCIPYRTVEDWCSGARECSIYVKLMMQQSLGLLTVDIKR